MASHKFNIRRISEKDYDLGVIELLSQLTIISKESISQKQFNDYLSIQSKNEYHFTIIVEDVDSKRIIGSATLLIEPKLIHNVSFVGHIEDVVVDTKYRGHGLGKMMIDHLSDKAELLNCYKVILDCSPNNVPFYSKCGFEEKGVEMGLYFK